MSPRSRSAITSLALVAVLVVVGIVFRGPLVAWFGGKSTVETKGPSLGPGTGMASASAPSRPLEYPQIAFDTLRSAMDAADRVRARLARDELSGVGDDTRALAEALRAAASGLPKDRSDLADGLARSSGLADLLAASTSLDQARHVFADVNAALIPIVAADARLTSGWHVFECPMFEHARWMQKKETIENPYMGTRMLVCGSASEWRAAVTTTSATPATVHHYTCSMHPSVKSPTPGKCPICGMDLVPVTNEQQEQGVVMIDEARRQLIGVRTARVGEGPMRGAFRAVGRVAYDEAALTDVNLKVRGWITQLYVNQTGQKVSRGQTLFVMYSPELYAAQQDFLLATQGAGAFPMFSDAGASRAESLGRAARQRLHLLGMSDAQIDAVAQKAAPLESIGVPSPASGYVIEKNVVNGASVDPGTRLYRIAALDKVWIEAEVYEADLPRVRVGQPAKVTLDYLPGRGYDAKVAYVYPYLDPKSRTGRVRIEIANKGLELRPGMYVTVDLSAEATSRVQVPSAAVVYTGPRRLVFVDVGQGRFRPQEIRVGEESNGMYEVLSGLSPGDVVATSGVFLIAAEARISTAAKYWESGSDDDAGAPMPMPSASAAPPPRSPVKRAPPTLAPSSSTPPPPSSPPTAAPSPSPAPPSATIYSCPMHPEVQSRAPGKCPKCGMDLVPRTKP